MAEKNVRDLLHKSDPTPAKVMRGVQDAQISAARTNEPGARPNKQYTIYVNGRPKVVPAKELLSFDEIVALALTPLTPTDWELIFNGESIRFTRRLETGASHVNPIIG